MIARALMLLALWSLPAAAQEAPVAATKRLYAEQVQCLAYYTFVRGCAIEQQEINVTSQANKTVEYLRKQAAQTAQRLKLDTSDVLKQQKAATDTLTAAATCDKREAVDKVHGMRCKQVTENPNAVLNEYSEKR